MKKKQKVPKVTKGTHRCSQTQCGYYIREGCPQCSECGAEPYIIKDACQRCMDCEHVPNSLRNDELKKKEIEQLTAEEETMAQKLGREIMLEMKRRAMEEEDYPPEPEKPKKEELNPISY